MTLSLEGMRGWMAGQDCLVVAPGPSADRVPQERYAAHWTIACNRAVTFARADFAVCLEPGNDLIWQTIAAAAPLLVFAHRAGLHPRSIVIDRDVEAWFGDERREPLSIGQSPFYAVAAAAWLGFWTVGLVGVDLTHDRYPHLQDIEAKWSRLVELVVRLGTRVVNLNPRSRLEAVEHENWSAIRSKSGLRSDRVDLPGAREVRLGDRTAPANAAAVGL